MPTCGGEIGYIERTVHMERGEGGVIVTLNTHKLRPYDNARAGGSVYA